MRHAATILAVLLMTAGPLQALQLPGWLAFGKAVSEPAAPRPVVTEIVEDSGDAKPVDRDGAQRVSRGEVQGPRHRVFVERPGQYVERELEVGDGSGDRPAVVHIGFDQRPGGTRDVTATGHRPPRPLQPVGPAEM